MNHIRLLIFVKRWRKEENKEEKEGERENKSRSTAHLLRLFPGAKLNHTMVRLIGTINSVLFRKVPEANTWRASNVTLPVIMK